MRVDARFNIAGFAGWLACMVPSAVDLYAGRLSGWHAGVWSAAFLAFGVTYARYLWRPAAQGRSTMDVLLISAQTGAGLAMVGAAYGMTKYLAVSLWSSSPASCRMSFRGESCGSGSPHKAAS